MEKLGERHQNGNRQKDGPDPPQRIGSSVNVVRARVAAAFGPDPGVVLADAVVAERAGVGDVVDGGEGDDWIEIGTQDGAPGDNLEPFSTDTVNGHDVFIGGPGFDEVIGEGGDDIMIGSEGADHFDGNSGFDWAVYKDDQVGVKVDLIDDDFVEPPVAPSNAGILGNPPIMWHKLAEDSLSLRYVRYAIITHGLAKAELQADDRQLLVDALEADAAAEATSRKGRDKAATSGTPKTDISEVGFWAYVFDDGARPAGDLTQRIKIMRLGALERDNRRLRRLLVTAWAIATCWDVHAFVVPMLGHGSWHAYRHLVDVSNLPERITGQGEL